MIEISPLRPYFSDMAIIRNNIVKMAYHNRFILGYQSDIRQRGFPYCR